MGSIHIYGADNRFDCDPGASVLGLPPAQYLVDICVSVFRHRFVWLVRFGMWLINEAIPAEKQVVEIGPQVGGIYWAMVMLLPKYFAFRYPAKLFVIASLALSLLAGISLRTYRPMFSRIGYNGLQPVKLRWPCHSIGG